MATFNYDRSQKTADRLIKKFGGSGLLLRHEDNHVGGIPIACAVLDFDIGQVNGTSIQAEDKLIYVSARGLQHDIEPVDWIQDPSGQRYQIVPPVRPLNPSGSTVVYYEIQGRR